MAMIWVFFSTQWCIRWQSCRLLSQHNGVFDGNHVGYCLNTMVYSMAIMSVIVSTQWCIRWQSCRLLSHHNGVLDGNHVGYSIV